MGESECPRYPGLPLSQPGATPATACPGCNRRWSKPGHYRTVGPSEVRAWVYRITELDLIRSRGASFGYPGALSVMEWRGLAALERADRERPREGESTGKQPGQVYNEASYKASADAYTRRKAAERAKAKEG